MSDLIIGVIVPGVILGAIVLLLGPDIVRLYTQSRRDVPIGQRWDRTRTEDEARRLLTEFQRGANGNLTQEMAIDQAAQQARVENPGPAVALLKEWGLVYGTEHGTRQGYVRLTPKGLRDAENAG